MNGQAVNFRNISNEPSAETMRPLFNPDYQTVNFRSSTDNSHNEPNQIEQWSRGGLIQPNVSIVPLNPSRTYAFASFT